MPLALSGLLAALAVSARAEIEPPDLSEMSLEELASVEVTSVSRRAEPISQAPASVYVISNEDIRRSGALSLPEALRLAPNLDVARLDAMSYAISARGFNSFQSSNKLLVLIDGRTVYTPLFSGVFWEQQNVMLEDLDRVEVISGPGGTLYGANAVNGVINVISRDAHDTQGALLTGAVSNTETDFGVRYGGRFGANGAFRIYATGFDRGHTLTPTGQDAGDGWDGLQGGFRADWRGEANAFTLQGDIYDYSIEAAGSLSAPGTALRGHNLLGRWTRSFDDRSALEVQAYYDKADRPSPELSDSLQTFDIQAQYATAWRERHELVFGGGYRWTSDEFIFSGAPIIDPESRDFGLANVFLQDKIRLAENLALTLGLKVQNSAFTGVEYLPNLRLAWQPSDRALLWAAISRAVRDPSRLERDLAVPGVLLPGTLDSEKLIALEAGYRGQPLPRTTLSITLYANHYDDIRTQELSAGGVQPFFFGNGIEGETYGVEAWGSYDLTERWRLFAGLNLLRKDLEVKPGRVDIANLVAAGNDPDYQFFLRSQVNLPHRVELDVRLRAVDERPQPFVPGYVEADARLGWRATEAVELYLAGFNLLDAAHPEDIDRTLQREIRRSVQAGARLRF
jgi:iron complex outermembrane receptor protein